MIFKEIKAVFFQEFEIKGVKVSQELAIERHVSGAHAYGDRSATTFYINGSWYETFDTRYEGITPDDFLKVWSEYLQEHWGLNKNYKHTLKSYKIEIVEI